MVTSTTCSTASGTQVMLAVYLPSLSVCRMLVSTVPPVMFNVIGRSAVGLPSLSIDVIFNRAFLVSMASGVSLTVSRSAGPASILIVRLVTRARSESVV